MSEAKTVLEQAIESWNAGDRDRWATLYADDVVYAAPGGQLRTPDGGEIPATGRKFEFPFVGIFPVEGGKIRPVEIYYDQFDLRMQLGLLPGAASN